MKDKNTVAAETAIEEQVASEISVDGKDEIEVNNSVVAEPDKVTLDPKKTSSSKPKRRFSVWWLVGILVVVVLLALVWIFWARDQFLYKDNASQANTSNQATTSTADEVVKQTDPQFELFARPTTGETWLSTPRVIAAQGWLKDETDAKYTEVGSRAGNTIYTVFTPQWGIAGGWFLFEKSSDGAKIRYIAHPQSTADYSQDDPWTMRSELMSTKVTDLDLTTHYDSLSLPATIKLAKGEVVNRPQYLGLSSWTGTQSEATKTLVLETKTSKLYRVEKKFPDTALTSISYELTLPIGTSINLDYQPNTLALKSYIWTNGDISTYKDYSGQMVYDELRPITRGCGGFSVSATRGDTLKKSDLSVAGKTDTGRSVYILKDTNNALFQKAYKEYADFIVSSDLGTPKSESEFQASHGLVIIENAHGEFLVYARSQLAPQYGCAKPVMYLYPTFETAVNVRVGATVLVSDPLYPDGGWKNVIARPDGQLIYQGKNYSSLFWEGPGVGEYPSITHGIVVRRAEAEHTMYQQLVQQGLNSNETADFMAFWAPKIPNTAYVRLTWFGSAELDQLAPLVISPKPDTVQRIFLDMSGLDKPTTLPSQTLHSFVRKGFTVVEWGGLSTMPR